MPTLGLSMIVKNGGEDLRACLSSVRGIVSQIVIADTGSTDNTGEIAAEFGATVVSYAWDNHFANARNAALAPITTDWVLVLDADEELVPEAAEAIPELLAASDGVGGYLVPIRNYFPTRYVYLYGKLSAPNHDVAERAKGAQSHAEHDLCRLFRRHSDIYYTGRIHEVVEHQVKALGMEIGRANFRILHFGQLAGSEVRERKNHFYRELGRVKTAEEPDNPLAWYELGSNEFVRFRNCDEARRCMERALALHPGFSAAWFLLAQIYLEERENEAALRALEQAENTGGRSFLVSHQKGDLLHDAGDLAAARRAYRKALELSQTEDSAPAASAIAAIESRLGYAEVRLGRHKAGLYKLRQAVKDSPGVMDNHDRLIKGAVVAGDITAAADAAEAMLGHFFGVKIFLRAAALRVRAGQPDGARMLLERGLRLFPQSVELMAMRRELEPSALPPQSGSMEAGCTFR